MWAFTCVPRPSENRPRVASRQFPCGLRGDHRAAGERHRDGGADGQGVGDLTGDGTAEVRRSLGLGEPEPGEAQLLDGARHAGDVLEWEARTVGIELHQPNPISRS